MVLLLNSDTNSDEELAQEQFSAKFYTLSMLFHFLLFSLLFRPKHHPCLLFYFNSDNETLDGTNLIVNYLPTQLDEREMEVCFLPLRLS